MASLDVKNRSRSPRFPSHSVKEAIRFATQIYEGVHRSPIEPETVYKLMGFSGKSGASAKALGSIRQYGLIDGVSNNTRVSDLTLRLLEPSSELEHYEAVLDAAYMPDVFQDIHARFEDVVPAADEPIRAFLIRELGFSQKGAEQCLSSFRETLNYIDTIKEPDFASKNTGSAIEANEKPIEDKPQDEPLGNVERLTELIRVPLTRDCTAELKFSGAVTSKAIDNLVRHIELMSEVWRED